MNTLINNACDCGRKRGDMNDTNWSRHKESCKNKKIKLSHNSNIKNCFVPINYSVNSKCVISSEYFKIIYYYFIHSNSSLHTNSIFFLRPRKCLSFLYLRIKHKMILIQQLTKVIIIQTIFKEHS